MDHSEESKFVATLLSTKEGLQWRKVHHSKARLESSKRTSIILAIFSYSVFTSLQLNYPTECPPWIFTILAVNSALLVGMHSFAFLISTFLLPQLKAVVKEYKCPIEGDKRMNPVPIFSPHDRFSGFVLLSYNVSHILGLFLFLLEIPLIAWVKFWDVSLKACISCTVIIIPAAIVFGLFCWYFQRSLTIQIYHSREHLIEDVEREYTRTEETLVTAVASPQNFSTSRNHNLAETASLKSHLSPNYTKNSHHTLPSALFDSQENLIENNDSKNLAKNYRLKENSNP